MRTKIFAVTVVALGLLCRRDRPALTLTGSKAQARHAACDLGQPVAVAGCRHRRLLLSRPGGVRLAAKARPKPPQSRKRPLLCDRELLLPRPRIVLRRHGCKGLLRAKGEAR